MSARVRPRRSVLYMPGSNARALAKAKSLPSDALIFDLEDAVAPDAKVSARDQVCAAVGTGGYGPRELIIRVNALATPWGLADLAAVAVAGADAVLIPKVESADAVRQALAVLDDAGAPSDLPIWCMMETPRAMLRAEEIAAADPRIGCLVMGRPIWPRSCMPRTRRSACPSSPRLACACSPHAPVAARSWMACTWTWRTTQGSQHPVDRGRSLASTARP